MAPGATKQSRGRSKDKEEEGEMEKYITGREKIWKKILEKIFMEIEEMRKEMRKNMEEMRGKMYEERKRREEDRRRKKKECKKEKEKLVKRILDLEWINERNERKERKINIVIKRINWQMENVEHEVENFIRDSIKVNLGVKKVSRISTRENKSMVPAELSSWEQKREIMMRKRKLNKEIIIEDNVIEKEKSVQQNLKEMARKEREK